MLTWLQLTGEGSWRPSHDTTPEPYQVIAGVRVSHRNGPADVVTVRLCRPNSHRAPGAVVANGASHLQRAGRRGRSSPATVVLSSRSPSAEMCARGSSSEARTGRSGCCRCRRRSGAPAAIVHFFPQYVIGWPSGRCRRGQYKGVCRGIGVVAAGVDVGAGCRVADRRTVRPVRLVQ
jgi:hypothetical protein